MREIHEIVEIIDSHSKKKYGSINKMLAANKLNKSVIDNMKREKPSIPNIQVICTIANDLDISLDWLLNNYVDSSCTTHILQENKSFEQELLDLYSQLDERSKGEVLGFIKAKLN